MRKLLLVFSIGVLFLSGLLYLSRQEVDFALPLSAAEIWSAQQFQAMTPYGVPEAHDTETTKRKKPAIFWGYDTDGAVTVSAGTYQYAFNTSCDFRVLLTVIQPNDIADESYSAKVKTYNTADSSFSYEVRKSDSGTITDVTATVPVFWVAFGWR